MDRIKNIIRVTCAVIQNENLFLVCQRSLAMSMPLKWEFPGGKLEPGEDESDCIKREIKEELQVEIQIEDRLNSCHHHYKEFTIELIPFRARIKEGTIYLKEHIDLKWLSLEELNFLDLAEADKPILEELRAFFK